MKKLLIALFLLTGMMATKEAKAQVSVNINIGNQPAWGPVGYDYVNFYYLPEINCYYDVMRGQFICLSGPRWVYMRSLPPRYRSYNLYNTYKVVVNQPSPYRYNSTHVREYARYRGMRSQPVIRDSRDSRYYESRYHPQHKQWKREHGRRGPDNRSREYRNDNRQDNRSREYRNDNRQDNGRGHGNDNGHNRGRGRGK
jgi:hypothetical protein